MIALNEQTRLSLNGLNWKRVNITEQYHLEVLLVVMYSLVVTFAEDACNSKG